MAVILTKGYWLLKKRQAAYVLLQLTVLIGNTSTALVNPFHGAFNVTSVLY